MRIAIFVGAFPVWTETFIVNQITGLIDRGHDVDIFATERRDLDSRHAILDAYGLVDRARFLATGRLSAFGKIKRFLSLLFGEARCLKAETWRILFRVAGSSDRVKGWTGLSLLSIALPRVGKAPYDVLHCQFGNLGPRVLRLKQSGLLEGKLVTSFRGHDATQERFTASNFYAELFESGELFLPVSARLGERLVSMGCDASRIKVLHSGIDCRKFRFAERRLREAEPVRLISVARFVEMKGLRYALEGIAVLLRQGYSMRYQIVGDGDLRAELEDQIAELGLGDVVELAGWQSHEVVTTMLEEAHILLAPSVTAANGETEGIPNAVKEAMATGIPVLSTRHGGISELVQHGQSGFLVAERDSEALAESLRRLIDDPAAWASMGRVGRAFVEQEFDMEQLNDALVAHYRA